MGPASAEFVASGLFHHRGYTIAGGTSEVQHNIIAKQVLGLIYIPVFLSFLILLRFDQNGAQWIFWLLLIVAAGDTGAFYAGTYLGRHKLCPWVSPKKTIEGSLGGLAANTLVALVFKMILLPSLATLPCVVFALVIGIAGYGNSIGIPTVAGEVVFESGNDTGARPGGLLRSGDIVVPG